MTEDEERIKNQAMYLAPLTDAELEKASSSVSNAQLAGLIVIIVIIGLIMVFAIK